MLPCFNLPACRKPSQAYVWKESKYDRYKNSITEFKQAHFATTLLYTVVTTMAFIYLWFHTKLNFKDSLFSPCLHTLSRERLQFSNAQGNPNTAWPKNIINSYLLTTLKHHYCSKIKVQQKHRGDQVLQPVLPVPRGHCADHIQRHPSPPNLSLLSQNNVSQSFQVCKALFPMVFATSHIYCRTRNSIPAMKSVTNTFLLKLQHNIWPWRIKAYRYSDRLAIHFSLADSVFYRRPGCRGSAHETWHVPATPSMMSSVLSPQTTFAPPSTHSSQIPNIERYFL